MSGGGSSIGYADYIMGIHNIVMRGGKMAENSSDPDPESLNFERDDGLIRKLQVSLDDETIYDDKEDFIYDPNASRSVPDSTGSKSIRTSSNLNTFLARIEEEVDLSTQLTKEDLETLITNAKDVDSLRDELDTEALNTLLLTLFSSASTNANSATSSSLSKNRFAVTDIFTNLKGQVSTDIDNTITDAIATINNAINTDLEADVTKVNNLVGSLTTTVVDSISSRVNTTVTRMLNTVAEFNSEITTLVDAYTDQGESKHQKAIGRLTASMGQSGSNMSSALSFGLSNLEEERIRDIQLYRANLELELRDKIFSIYSNAGAELNAAYSAYQTQISNDTAKLTSFVNSYVSGYISNLQSVMGSIQQAHGTNMQVASERGRATTGLVSQATLQDQATRERDRYNTFATLINDKNQSYQDYLALNSLLSQVSQMSYIANKEYYDKLAELKFQDLRWDLDTYAYLGNFLGAPGSSVSKSNDLTTRESVMAGITTGAMVGTVGGISGAVGGAVVGGILGGVSAATSK